MNTKLYETLPKEDVDAKRETRPQAQASSRGASDRNQRQSSSVATDRPIPIRPHIYYGEGTFDPPSSDSEAEEEQLLEKGAASPGAAERGLASTLANDGTAGLIVGGQKRPASIRFLLWSLCALLLLAAGIGFLSARSYSGTSFRFSRGTRKITLDHIFNGTFSASKTNIRWVPEMGDGVLAFVENNSIKLVDLKTNTSSIFVTFSDIRSEAGAQLMIYDWQVSSDGNYILVKTDYKKQWRWSSYGNYYIYNIETRTTHPLAPVSYPPLISYAKWSPKGNAIAYVLSNDLYIQPTPNPDEAPVRVTDTGNATFFNGVADWVYEEEVFSSPSTLWWSPDSSKLAFLTLDETLVPEYTFPIYNPSDSSSAVYPYTKEVVMKYPKPGYPNPFVSVRVFNFQKYLDSRGEDFEFAGIPIFEATLTLDWPDRLPSNESIIYEVSWVGNETLIVKEVDRAASVGNVVLFDFAAADEDAQGTLVRKLGRDGEGDDGGWIESSKQTIYPLPPSLTNGLIDGSEDYIPAYLDIVNDTAGYNHIALFAPVSSDKPIFLTSGDWEVTGGILGVDVTRRLIYFQAAFPVSTERNIFSVELPSSINSTEEFKPEINAITDTSRPNHFTADFSPQAEFYMLSYQGPNVPWQSIFEAADKDFVYPITENARLNATLLEFQSPIMTWTTIQSDGYELNAREIRPPNMDDSGRTKYPVLFYIYGGPGSQYVTTEYTRDWHHYLASALKYVVVTVDGRGTGFKGRGLRNPVRGQLGVWEAVDQMNAARIWASKPYIDSKKIGIYGSSYGGFLTSKVVEANAGIHSLAMAIAPVTNWRLYDSIYTERYMGLPSSNPDGYTSASITNTTGFQHVDYLLVHGSGDDNVHFQNSAHLIDMLTQNGVRDFRFRMFTDSDHSLYRRGAHRELYEFLTSFLVEKWGKGGRRYSW